MSLLLFILFCISIISLLTVIGFLITLLVGFIINKVGPKKTGKIGLYITIPILLISFLGSAITSSNINAERDRQIAIEDSKNKKFKKAADDFSATLYIASINAEDIGNKEYKAWRKAIDDSAGDDYDVNDTIEKITSDNESDISSLNSDISTLYDDLKIMNKNDTKKYNYSLYKKTYKEINKFADFVTSPSGSYNDFSDGFSDIDKTVANAYSELSNDL